MGGAYHKCPEGSIGNVPPTEHDVYFGAGTPLAFVRNQTESVFEPGTLRMETTYWWRIDERNDSGKTTGQDAVIVRDD